MVWQAQAGVASAFGPVAVLQPKIKRTDKTNKLLEEGLGVHQSGNLDRALQVYRQVMGLDPENVPAMTASALIYSQRGEHDAAEWLLRRSLEIAPTCVAYNSLGLILTGRRRYDEAVNAYRASLELDPSNLTTWPNLLFALDLHPGATPELCLAERRRFNDLHCKALTDAAEAHTNDPDPERRLRVGYVSADFKQHSAAHGFGPVVLGHDKDRVETYLYDVMQAPPVDGDRVSGWFQEMADCWRDARGSSDEALAAMIRADQIDILVDLSGYSAGGRVLAFARKPAPIQIGGFGYGTGTGIDAMDYLIGDAVTIPPQHEGRYRERIMRLPVYMAFEKAPPWPTIGPAPQERNGYVTYGYLGRAVKLSDQTLATWADILRRVPDSRLLLKSSDYDDAAVASQIRGALAALGVAPNRVEIRTGTHRFDHMAAYNEVDVALDSFPHSGGVTSVEALLMGVPIVTLPGEYFCSRTGASILTVAELGHAVARNPYEYVKHAVDMASEEWTQGDRRALRVRLCTSPLFDDARYVRAVEGAYREAWREWCAGRAAA